LVALTLKVTLVLPHWPGSAVKVRFPGQLITGGRVRLPEIVTVKVQVLVVPKPFEAVLVTVVTPMGKVLPLGGVLTTGTEPQLFVAFTVNVTLARLHWPGFEARVRLDGQEITGACVSLTVTVKLQFAPASLVQLTVVMPTGKKEPLAGAQVVVPQFPAVLGWL